VPPVLAGARIGAPDKPGHDDRKRRGMTMASGKDLKHLFLAVALALFREQFHQLEDRFAIRVRLISL
jgi:hypothetical protein